MADSVEQVTEIIDQLYSKSKEPAAKEMQEIFAFAQSIGFTGDALAPSDVTFYSDKFKKKQFNLDDEKLKEYFPLPKVLPGLFAVAKRLFGVTVKQRTDGSVNVWDKSVMFFDIFEGDVHVASFYLDPYARPANKRGGAWMDDCICRSSALKQEVPVAYLVCNGTKPVQQDGVEIPSLMLFSEVTTLFHEFGHGLQHMLTRVNIGEVSGISGIEWDAVELPSQFMENWCLDRKTLFGMAKHYKTGETIPEKMYQSLSKRKNFGAGMMMMRQLQFAQLDMNLHSKYHPDKEGKNMWTFQHETAEKFCAHNPPIPEDRFLCAFGHIFSSYAAGYYSYKWAEVMSADAFGAFEDVGLDNEEAVQKLGRHFRETVLGLGGSVKPANVYEKFRGRKPTVDALLRHSGLVGEVEKDEKPSFGATMVAAGIGGLFAFVLGKMF